MADRVLRVLGMHAPPRGAALRRNLAMATAFTLLFIVVYGGADLIGANSDHRYLVSFGFEARLPFVPWMAIIYLSILPMMLLAAFVFNTPARLFPLVVVLSLEVLVAGVFFIVFPIQATFPPHDSETSNTFIFALADTLNLRYNYLPSLHVALSLTTAVAMSQHARSWGKALYLSWGVAISISSILMHQHHIADVVAGSLLALTGMYVVYPRVSTPEFLRAVRLEYICLAQFRLFIQRHRRYLVIALFLYAHSVFRWRKTRVMRTGFCLLQALDDLLDGDRKCGTDPRLVAADIARQLQTGDFGTDRLSALAESLAGDLHRLQAADDDPVAEVVALIQHMAVDRERVEQALIFDAEQLRRHHRKTFVHSLNLLLIAAGARTRAAEVPELVEAFGWCSTVRDLEDDLQHGLINVPGDVVAAARQEGVSLEDTDAFLEAGAVQEWFEAELHRADALLEAHAERAVAGDDPAGRRILRLFDRSIGTYVRKFEHLRTVAETRSP